MNKPDPRLEELLTRALACELKDHVAFLDQACGGDKDLRKELEELLSLQIQADGYFDSLSDDINRAAAVEVEAAVRPKTRIGPYQIDELAGRGGMGVVYRASRVDGEFDQQVALKLLHLDMLTPQVRARFLSERQLLAKFQHPNISRLLDGGVTDEGRPYFVMELIGGQPITTYCNDRKVSLEDVLRLFLQAVDAVGYLHRNLVVHRDLKPSNIFVRDDGVVKLLDFGVAKLLAGDEATNRTLTGEQLMTPRYAAPEQLANEPITTATDVYGLGLVLYELLAGALPADRTVANFTSIERETTTAPSSVLKSANGTKKIVFPWRRVSGDLDNICLKALRLEPERRYASAEQLAQDINRHLSGLPVNARPSTIGYRASKFIGRHRVGAAAGIALVGLLGLGLARERDLRSQTQQEANKAKAVSAFLGSLISSADPAVSLGEEVTVADVLDQAEDALNADGELSGQPQVEAEVRLVLGRTYEAIGRTTDAQVQLGKAIELAGGLEFGDAIAVQAAAELGVNASLRGSDREEATSLLRRVLAIREAKLGAEHDDTLQAMSNLSRTLRQPENMEEAEALDRKVLDARTRILGPKHPDTLRAMNSLAGVLFGTARYEEAAGFYAQGLETARTRLGTNHPDTLRFASNLGAAYTELGRYAEAEPLQRLVVEQRLRLLGPNHHQTGMSMHNLGVTLIQLAKYSDAESFLRQATTARSEVLAGYLYSQSFLADALRESGKEREAEKLYLDAITQQRELGPDFADTYRTILALGQLRFRQGQLNIAEKLASEALEAEIRINGEQHPDTIASLDLIARIQFERGQIENATESVGQALAAARATFDRGHPVILELEALEARIRTASTELAGENS